MAFDILLDMDNELPNGDIVLGDGDAQNIEALMLAPIGTFKHAPMLGIGFIANARLSNAIQLEGDIKKALKDDNWVNEIISIDADQYYVKANRND
jgi:hypothetical protein